jgi:hypothetical protein
MKKILSIELLDPQFTNKDFCVIGFGFNEKSNKQTVVLKFVEGVCKYAESGTDESAFLTGLIVSASECLQEQFPDLKAVARKARIEVIKFKNKNK